MSCPRPLGVLCKAEIKRRPASELPQIVRTSQKAPGDVRIRSFSRRGVVPAAPLQFLAGYAHGCRIEYSGQPSRWHLKR